ncbi:hypothetical protein lacNasYZ03_10360 [Lactobacillus nasalidis]|uniref:Uncharacterized protein n=1 Tax=Lactobacillus nasalidis TaxID=2797258 RepID=A0ABQ3W7N8_9LACO|nr:hypothetical protein [Lactobacillus nasalidis]GHV97550.1 hypothetical protein lacNasYZ01_07320 [Lactobacillus nasalidis]GHV99272.1 hypothetical protein lacNasYZ02_07020 [Lactobacillus nasalidis]GHW01349.1 hypothetical protein lacNasYZ03_10360 [Lactobacillus nasalidis]
MLYIRIFMTLFIACMLLTAWYLWHRRNGAFLVFDVSSSPKLHTLMTVCAWALLAVSILGIVLLFFDNKYLNLITLFLGSGVIFIFALLVSQNKQ